MDGKLALLYLIVVALITFSYIDDENLGVMKQAITAFAVALSLSRFYPDLTLGLMFCAFSIAGVAASDLESATISGFRSSLLP